MLAVELAQLESLSRGRRRTRDHVGDLAGDIEITAAVVADVEDQIVHAGALQLAECGHEFALRGRDMVVEEHVSDEVSAGRQKVCTFCTGVSVMLADTSVTVRGVAAPGVQDREGVGFTHRLRA